MTIDGCCRRSSIVPVLFWTSIFLLSLACGIHSVNGEHIRQERSARNVRTYSPSGIIQLQALNFLREFIQRRQQQQLQQATVSQTSNNGDRLSENVPDVDKLPLRLLLQMILAGQNEESKEERKRGSYMALCHFKICNMGRKRSGVKLAQRYRK